MFRIFLLICAYLFMGNASSASNQSSHLEVEVDVEQSTEGYSEHEVRELAKLKAQYTAYDLLPGIIYGSETAIDDNLTTKIKALRAGQLNVVVLNEKWLPEDSVYSLSAKVIVNKSKTLELLEIMHTSEKDRKMMAQLDMKLDKALVDKNTDLATLTALTIEQLSITKSLFVKGTLSDSLEAVKSYSKRIYEITLNYLLKGTANSLKAELQRVEPDQFFLKINFPNKSRRKFTRIFQALYGELASSGVEPEPFYYFDNLKVCYSFTDENNVIREFEEYFSIYKLKYGLDSILEEVVVIEHALTDQEYSSLGARFKFVPCITGV